jgi:hypothetical protein
MFLLVNQPTHAKMFQTSLLLKDLKGTWVNFFLVKPSRFGAKSWCWCIQRSWWSGVSLVGSSWVATAPLHGPGTDSWVTWTSLFRLRWPCDRLEKMHVVMWGFSKKFMVKEPDPLRSVTHHFLLQCRSLIWSKHLTAWNACSLQNGCDQGSVPGRLWCRRRSPWCLTH